MSNLEHLFENLLNRIEKDSYLTKDKWIESLSWGEDLNVCKVYYQVRESDVVESLAILSDKSRVNLDNLWELAIYTTTTYKQDILYKNYEEEGWYT